MPHFTNAQFLVSGSCFRPERAAVCQRRAGKRRRGAGSRERGQGAEGLIS
ncbi:MAG: hypothetical protein IPL28_22800 [Chloroflexi bacterium]|nr:hypothetical protein [Chloroflexota bacterium]